MWRKYLVFSSMVCVVFAIVVSVAYQSNAAEKDSLIIGSQDDTVSLDPARTGEKDAMAMINQMYEKLVRFDTDTSKPIPEIAESWDVGQDGKTWTFHLKKDGVFSSGNPINADAVVYSLRRTVALQGNSAWLLTQFGITEEGITKVDDSTIRIVLSQQYAPEIFLACLASSIGSILDQQVVQSHVVDNDQGGAWLDTHAAGSGRFVLEDRVPRDHTIMNANPKYRGTPPSVNSVVIKYVAEPIEQAVLLEKGEIDVAWNLQPDQIKRLEMNPDVRIFDAPTSITYYMAMSLTHAPFSKPEVRKALRYALNYDDLVDFVLQGVATKTQSIVPPGLLGYSSEFPYSYSPDKAKELLAAAGYADGFDMELACLNYAPWTDIAMQIKSDLSKIGVRVKIVEKNSDDLMTLCTSRTFQAYIWEWELNYPDPDAIIKSFAHSDKEGDNATVKLAAWETHYVNTESSLLTEQAIQETDMKKREQLYQQINAMLLDDGPFTVLASPKKQYAIRVDAENLVGLPSALSSGLPTIR